MVKMPPIFFSMIFWIAMQVLHNPCVLHERAPPFPLRVSVHPLQMAGETRADHIFLPEPQTSLLRILS
jgi:hypothetical protein